MQITQFLLLLLAAIMFNTRPSISARLRTKYVCLKGKEYLEFEWNNAFAKACRLLREGKRIYGNPRYPTKYKATGASDQFIFPLIKGHDPFRGIAFNHIRFNRLGNNFVVVALNDGECTLSDVVHKQNVITSWFKKLRPGSKGRAEKDHASSPSRLPPNTKFKSCKKESYKKTKWTDKKKAAAQ